MILIANQHMEFFTLEVKLALMSYDIAKSLNVNLNTGFFINNIHNEY